MTSTASRWSRRCAGVLALVLVAAACSSDNDSDDTSAPDTGVADTEVDVDPDDFTPAGTDVVANPSSGDDAASEDDPPSLDQFCVASRPYYIQSAALQFIDGEDDAAAETLLRAMEVSAQAAAGAAPSAEFAAPPQAAADALAVLIPELETIDFDIERLEELSDSERVAQLLGRLIELENDLADFLIEQCGDEPSELEQDARDLAAAVEGGADIPAPTTVAGGDPDEGAAPTTTDAGTEPVATTTPDTTSPPATTTPPPTTESPFFEDIVEIEDDTGLLVVDVPATWSDTITAPDGETRQLGASADMDVFLGSFSEPGMLLVSADVADATAAWQAALDATSASAQADGCTIVDEGFYDDGVYEGTEILFSCPGTTAETRLIGGESPIEEIYFLLALVVDAGDIDTYELIIDTFLID